VEVRPLDYDYLTSLTPGAQRFYELLSFQMYGAIAGGRPRAKMRYSEYCNHAPQSRYMDFDHVKKQMFKIHAPHREAGYVAKVDYEATIDGEGSPDWEMFYSPGPRAIAEFEAFTRRQVRSSVQPTALPAPDPVDNTPTAAVSASALVAELTRRGIAERKARELLANLQPGQEPIDQIEYVDSLVAKDTKGRIANPPGLYVMYVRDNVAPPENFLSSRKRALIAQAKQQKRDAATRDAQLRLDYEAFCTTETTRFIERELPAAEYRALFDAHRRENRQLLRHLTDLELDDLTRNTVFSEIRRSGRIVFPSLERFTRGERSSAEHRIPR
jgi:hypothetical protein